MHYCEEFRERITEHIIDRENLMGSADFQQELLVCPACLDFYAESREMIEALSAVDLTISQDQWTAMDRRLPMRSEVIAMRMPPVSAPRFAIIVITAAPSAENPRCVFKNVGYISCVPCPQNPMHVRNNTR